MRGAPYADCFVVETRVRVTARREGGTAADAACRVEWKKSVNGMIMKLVHAGAKDQLKKSYAKMLDLAAGEARGAHAARARGDRPRRPGGVQAKAKGAVGRRPEGGLGRAATRTEPGSNRPVPRLAPRPG